MVISGIIVIMPNRDYEVGNLPPQVLWTIVRGDSASFRIYVTDENKVPLNIEDWYIDLDIRRNNALVLSLEPSVTAEDQSGEFTVSLTPQESTSLQTDDLFDVQLSDKLGEDKVWTVIQGKIKVVEDITAPRSPES
jgi:hypothetical protein